MIDETRVKEMYRLAVYDAYEEKKNRAATEYFRWDYVGKELVKSFFSGTLAFLLLALLLVLRDLSSFLSWLNRADWVDFGMHIAALYLGFLALYLLLTVFLYVLRYEKGRAGFKRFTAHMKKLRKLTRADEQ